MEQKELFSTCPLCGDELVREKGIFMCAVCDSTFSHDDLCFPEKLEINKWDDEDDEYPTEEEDMFWV